MQTASSLKLATAPAPRFTARDRSLAWMPKRAIQSPNDQRTCSKYGSELETRISAEAISLEFNPSSVDDAYSQNMLSNSLKDLETGLLRVTNRETEAEIHSKDLATFSESINESPLQEECADGRRKHITCKIQENGKGSKRKAEEMERKVASCEIPSGKKIEEDSRIVRVSQLNGGKDRHSKVLTAKGLRDRRVRLSVPTAIQLYDLQDRLGVEQPSMAVDWLIKAAKSAVDELNVLDTEMASASAGNMAQLTSSDCSTVEHCAGSPRETAASALSAFRVGQGSISHKATNGKDISITTPKESDLGRSSSNSSDGSIKGSAEHTSYSSMSKSVSRKEARLKARERARRKSSSAKNSGGSPPVIHQLKSMQPSLTSMFNNFSSYTTHPLESQCSKDDNPCGVQAQVFSEEGCVQQLLDYNNTPSYTDMLCTQDSHPLQNMASSLTAALHKSFQPVPSTLAGMQAALGGSLFQSYEMADSAFPFFHSKQSQHLEGSTAEGQGNHFFPNIPNIIMKSVEQQQQAAQINVKKFSSPIDPTFSNDIHISTSSLSSKEPLLSNSSSATNMPSFSHTQKNAFGEASARGVHDFLHLQDYDARIFQDSHTVQHNVNLEHNQPWAKEKRHFKSKEEGYSDGYSSYKL